MSNLEIAIRIVERQKYISSKALCTALGDEGIRVDGKELKNDLIRVSHDKNSPIGAIGNDGADAFLNPDVFYSRKWFLQYGTSGRPVERIGCHLNRLILENGWQYPFKEMADRLDAEYLLKNLEREKRNGIVLSVLDAPPLLHEFLLHYQGVCPAKCENRDYLSGLDHLRTGDIGEAERSFLTASHSLCAQAEYQLGIMIMQRKNSGCDNSLGKAIFQSHDVGTAGGAYLLKSARHGYPVAQYEIGCEYLKAAEIKDCELEETDDPQEEGEGQKFLKAAVSGIEAFLTGCDAEAERVAAEMFYFGRGFRRDKDSAMSLLHSAVTNGSIRAKELLRKWESKNP